MLRLPVTVAVLGVVAMACAVPQRVPVDAGLDEQDGGSDAGTDAGADPAWPQSCPSPIPNSAEVLEPGALVVVGEIHGTEQIPRFVVRLACDAALLKVPVVVGLELPVGEQAALDAYLASEGGTDARAALVAGDFWTQEFQDGRSSEAMVALLDGLRQLRPAVRVFAFDVGASSGLATRDLGMADRVRQERQAAASNEIFILHTGNVHARITRGVPWNANFEPMAYDLRKSFPELVSLDVLHAGGTAWVCTGATAADCKATNLSGTGAASGDGIEVYPQPGTFHGHYEVGAITASPPAVQ